MTSTPAGEGGRVRSADGTAIAYERAGQGPAVVLVGGGLTERAENAPLAAALAGSFTVVNYDRRGRGASGDTAPYAVGREIEDLAALVAAVGGPAHLYGVSSGGALALEAAAAGLPAGRVAVYDVPYSVGEEDSRDWRAYVEELTVALEADRRDEALALFMRLAGSSEADVAGAQASPFWPGLADLAPTLAYDAACLGNGPPPGDRLALITTPTLVMTGSPELEASPGFFARAADAVAAFLPDAERLTLPGQGHVADPAVVSPVLERFFST